MIILSAVLPPPVFFPVSLNSIGTCRHPCTELRCEGGRGSFQTFSALIDVYKLGGVAKLFMCMHNIVGISKSLVA
jgi:hypothetical protein